MIQNSEQPKASTNRQSEDREHSKLGRILRWTLPFLVSMILLGWIFSGIDLDEFSGRLTAQVMQVFLPVLAVFLVMSLTIEAICLVRVVSQYHEFSSLILAARIKAASYLLGLINYALGAGAVTLLLRRRAGVPLAQAAGSVILIALFDLGSLIFLVLLGLGFHEADAAWLQTGLVAAASLAMLAGFAVLRTPRSLGPLDRLRDLEILQAARTLPIGILAQLGLLRLVLVTSFVALTGFTLYAFGVEIPLVPMVIGVCILLLISAIPIAAAGLGTGQVAFVALFEGYAEPETLLAASLTVSFGLILTRASLGFVFAHEFSAEAFRARGERSP